MLCCLRNCTKFQTNIFCKTHVECCVCIFSIVNVRILPFYFCVKYKLLNRQEFFDFLNDFVNSIFSCLQHADCIWKVKKLFIEFFDWIQYLFDVVNIIFLILLHSFFKLIDSFFQFFFFFNQLWNLCVKQLILHLIDVDYKMASFLYRSYGSRMFLDVSVSSNRSRTSSRSAFSLYQMVVISCSASIWFANSVCNALCCVFLNSSRLIDSLLQCWLFGRMWWIE